MRVELGMARGAKTRDRKLAMMRKAATMANSKYGIGGRPKTHYKPKTITLPQMKFLASEVAS